ncbi:unnamed protein product [Symbiodinium necroappetens]|uniref:Uncharacterized protein n=1 Tax=Symbiodinium necroappetens TaxID=1628268 RepID=A0A812K3N0_9DINO|nr:unnamed protein product [Symbiodinium necroappetens]
MVHRPGEKLQRDCARAVCGEWRNLCGEGGQCCEPRYLLLPAHVLRRRSVSPRAWTEHGHAMGLLEQGPGGHRAECCLARRHLPEGRDEAAWFGDTAA